MKKFTCEIILANSNEENPQAVVEFEYFIRSEDIFEALDEIKTDLKLINNSEKRAIEISIDEVTSNNVQFPDGNGIVSKQGPKELVTVKEQNYWQAIKEMFKR